MKKVMLALLLFAATATMVMLSSETTYARSGGNSGGGNSNSIPASQVPKPVKRSFKSMYPMAAEVEWEYKPVYYGTPVYSKLLPGLTKMGSQLYY